MMCEKARSRASWKKFSERLEELLSSIFRSSASQELPKEVMVGCRRGVAKRRFLEAALFKSFQRKCLFSKRIRSQSCERRGSAQAKAPTCHAYSSASQEPAT